jgi:hypothetical protein
MRCRRLTFVLLLLSSLVASGKDKKKVPLPEDVLKARTVWVIVDPKAGIEIQAPNANRIARADVEKALVKWGRLEPVTDAETADLIITVRKGHGKVAEGTIGGTQINRPPPLIGQSTDSEIHGAGRTRSGTPDDPSNAGSSSTPSPEVEIGASEDMFVVYRSRAAGALDSPPVWRYTAKDALESPDVPAVEVFRKLIVESEKKLAGTP